MASTVHIDSFQVEQVDSSMPRRRKLTTIDLIGGIYCHICQKTFSTKKDYELHYILHNTIDAAIQYTCVVCHKIITGYNTFRNHCYNMHTNANKFKCQHCERSFHKAAVLNLHIKSVHIFKCKKPNCKKQFSTENELHMHEFVHRSKANKPPYQCKSCDELIGGIDTCEHHVDCHSHFCYNCPICGAEITKQNAGQHLATHFGSDCAERTETKSVESEVLHNSSINIVGGIRCCHCQEIYKNHQELDMHFEENHPKNEISYTCIICNKQYTKYSQFGSHVYEHHTKNKFKCEQCPRLFPRLALLVQHVSAQHGAAGALPCDRCLRFFATERHRRHHIREKHQEDKLTCSYQGCTDTFDSPKARVFHEKLYHKDMDNWCRSCGLEFGSPAAAERHLDVHCIKRYACPVCAQPYNEKYLVMNHVTQHFESVFHMCKVCAKVFNAKNRLIEHLKTHSNVKSYECQHCGRSFAKTNHLEQHVVMHTELKPYKCSDCDKAFTNYPNYHKHMRKMHKVHSKALKKSVIDKQHKNINAKVQPKEQTKLQPTQETKQIVSPDSTRQTSEPDASSMDPDSIDSIEIDKDSHIFKNISTDCSAIIEFDSDIEDMLVEPAAPAVEPVIYREIGPDFVSPDEALVTPLPAEYIQLDDLPLPHIDPMLTIMTDTTAQTELPISPIPKSFPLPPEVPQILPLIPPRDASYKFQYDPFDANIAETIEDNVKLEAPVFSKIYSSLFAELEDMSATRLAVLNTDMY